MANTNNNIDFVLKAGCHSGGHIISQLPPQYMKRFEVVERFGTTYFISKPHVPPGEIVSYIISNNVLYSMCITVCGDVVCLNMSTFFSTPPLVTV